MAERRVHRRDRRTVAKAGAQAVVARNFVVKLGDISGSNLTAEVVAIPQVSPGPGQPLEETPTTGNQADCEEFRWWASDNSVVKQAVSAFANGDGTVDVVFPALVGPNVDLYYGGGDAAMNVCAGGQVAPAIALDVPI